MKFQLTNHFNRSYRTFKPDRKFKKHYDRLFKKDPLAANIFLLICELANERGRFVANEQEIADLMAIRFNDPMEYALGGMTNV
jgi:hypothetical protein